MGGKHATSSSTVSIPPEVLARYNAVNARAETAASKPFQSYGTQASDYVAPVNAQETMGMNTINASTGPASAGIDRYMSPYIKNVADTTGAMLKQQYEQGQSGALGTAASSGAFGGDRAGIAAANLQQQNQMGYGKTMADIMNQGYTQALGASQADLARGLQGGQMQMAAGAVQQQTEQAGKDAMVKRFMQEQGLPYQQAQFLANIAMGTGALSGSTTTSQTPTGLFGNLATGGKVEGYAGGGGVSGPMTSSQNGVGGAGYVPEGVLPVGELLVAPPQQDQGKKSGGFGDVLKILTMATGTGMASGGVAGGRHGYATDGFVNPFGIPPEDASPAWSSEDEAKHRAAIAAAEAALHPTAPTGVVAHGGPSFETLGRSNPGSLMDQANTADNLNNPGAPKTLGERLSAFTQPLRQAFTHGAGNLGSAEGDLGMSLTSAIPKAAGVATGLAGYSEKANDLLNTQWPPAPTTRPSQIAANLRMAAGEAPPIRSGMTSVAHTPSTGPLQHPVSSSGDFWAKMGASDSAIANARQSQGVAGPAAPLQHPISVPDAQGVAGATMVDATGNPVQSVTTPEQRQAQNGTPAGVAGLDDHTLFTSGIIPIESGGHQFRNGQPLTSSAGAIGIAQIMPGTGPEAAKLAGLPWDENRFKTDASYNAALGEAYFAQQRKTFGDPMMAAAAYNAGPGAVASAIDRATAHGGSYLDYLPAETQNYVKNFAARTGGTLPTGTGGLGGADMSAQKPYAERNVVGQFFHNPDGTMNRNAVLSLLSGLGTMASTRTLSPISALLQGVGGGAAAYNNLQNQEPIRAAANISNLNNLWTNYQNYIQSPNAQNVPFSQYAQSAGYTGPIPEGMQGAGEASATGPGGQYNVSAFTDTSNLSTLSNGKQVVHANDPGWLTNFITANQSYTQPNVVRAVEAARTKLSDMMTNGYTIASDGTRVTLPDQERIMAQQGLQGVKVQMLKDMGANASAIGSTYGMQRNALDSIVKHLPDINAGPQGGFASFVQNTAKEWGLPEGNTDYTGFVNGQLNNLLSGTTGSGLAAIDPQAVQQILGGQSVNIGTNMPTVVSQLGAVQGILDYNKDFSDFFNALPDDQKTDPNEIRAAFEKDHHVQDYIKKATFEVSAKASAAPGGNALSGTAVSGGDLSDAEKQYMGGSN